MASTCPCGNDHGISISLIGKVDFFLNSGANVLQRQLRLDSVLEGEGKKELKTPQQIQLEKKQREKNKLKQKPWLRKQRAKENKEARMKKREEQQMRPLSASPINFFVLSLNFGSRRDDDPGS